jgi:hypothetical protein
MSLYTLPSAQPQQPKPPRRLPGTPHWGVPWKHTIAALRAAAKAAMCHARLRPEFTADAVGSEVIERIDRLDGFALVILHIVVNELAKQSQKTEHRSW